MSRACARGEKAMTGLERCFAALEAAAIAGIRCPRNSAIIRTDYIERLARDGRIACKIYGTGWRVVDILTGANAGIATAPPPKEMVPWRSYGENGCTVDKFRHRERGRVTPRRRPSLPTITLRECL